MQETIEFSGANQLFFSRVPQTNLRNKLKKCLLFYLNRQNKYTGIVSYWLFLGHFSKPFKATIQLIHVWQVPEVKPFR